MSYNDRADARLAAKFNLPLGATMREIEGPAPLVDTEQCNGVACQEVVEEGDQYYATPCGTYCRECMGAHMKACEICRQEFED